MCVCSQTLGAQKSIKEYKNDMLLSVHFQGILKSRKLLNFVRKLHFYTKNMFGQPFVLFSPVVGAKLAGNFQCFFLDIGQLDLLLSCMHAFLSLKDAFYHKPEG